MTIADITFAVFTFCNTARVVAYVPQITKAVTDQDGARAISFTTWSLFLVSNTSAVAYALVNKDDWTMALLFLANAVGCSAIILIGALKRCQYRCRKAQEGNGTGIEYQGASSARPGRAIAEIEVTN